jgi:hypothetical protein
MQLPKNTVLLITSLEAFLLLSVVVIKDLAVSLEVIVWNGKPAG